MFKDLKKNCNLSTLVPLIGFFVLVIFLYQYSKGKVTIFDGMIEGHSVSKDANPNHKNPHGEKKPEFASGPQNDVKFASANGLKTSGVSSNSCNNKEIMDPSELLPKDNNNAWANLNPTGGADFKNVNLLNAGHHTGINTVGSSLRNPNLQLRSEFANPQMKTGPWNNTTMEPDNLRRPLELGVSNN